VTSPTFVADVRKQAWYPQVSSAMAQAGVPEYLWIGTIAAENPSAVGSSPQAIIAMNRPVYDPPGYSYGIFQFHNDPQGIDPVYAGSKAASIMGKALQPLGALASPRASLTAVERAAWPGNDPKLIAKEDPGRAAAMNEVIAQEQQLPLQGISDPNPHDNAVQQWLYTQTPIGAAEAKTNATASGVTGGVQNAINGAVTSINTTAKELGKQALVGGIIIAVIAGGFALLTAPDASEART
jgi:hypothetical protein